MYSSMLYKLWKCVIKTLVESDVENHIREKHVYVSGCTFFHFTGNVERERNKITTLFSLNLDQNNLEMETHII